MREINCDNAADYLRDNGHLAPGQPAEIRELAGGVSNVVLLVALPDRRERLVLKQARGRLRVKNEWLCPVERIWREVDVLRICGDVLRSHPEIAVQVPRILWEDRDNYLYAMTAAPNGSRTWKELLLAGELDAAGQTAAACGELLALLHGATWQKAAVARRLEDRTYFDQLRLDPYYRHVARVHPPLKPPIDALTESVWQHRRCLVHGDFSPKNLLVADGHITLIDFEVGHYGDPAFDLGFFLTHLALKAVWGAPRRAEYLALAAAFWDAYRAGLAAFVPRAELDALGQRLLLNLAGCLLARIDGKSPVDYLASEQQAAVRQLGIGLVSKQLQPANLDDLLAMLPAGPS